MSDNKHTHKLPITNTLGKHTGSMNRCVCMCACVCVCKKQNKTLSRAKGSTQHDAMPIIMCH